MLNAEYLESDPLARAEWIKFTALLFNREAEAANLFATIAAAYKQVSARVTDVVARPLVLAGDPYGGTWYIPGGQSYIARLIADAGGTYAWADNPSSGSVPVAFETVLARAATATAWFSSLAVFDVRDALRSDPRLDWLSPVRRGAVYSNQIRPDYWETGVIHPHLVLADIAAALHPDRFPGHRPVYYGPLELERRDVR
jgi:iron complex transport system substrate-binding protein